MCIGTHLSRADCAWQCRAFAVIITAILGMSCSAIDPPEQSAIQRQHKLMGKTTQEVLACAGAPIREYEQSDTAELVYYQEASLLEESFPGSKGSVSKTHHGCRANVQFKGGRLTGVRYQSVPSAYHDEDHCDDIFKSCAMSTSRP